MWTTGVLNVKMSSHLLEPYLMQQNIKLLDIRLIWMCRNSDISVIGKKYGYNDWNIPNDQKTSIKIWSIFDTQLNEETEKS
jgi:hypothetical protein